MTRTILLADDSVTIQKVVELTFMEGDYHVVAVGNGADAAQRLEDVQPDLVIADVHMPGLNGYDLCRRVKEWRAQTPVILLVGTFEPFDDAQARESGANTHLKKPFDSQDLVQRAAELLEQSGPAEPPAEPIAEPMPAMSEWALAEGDDTDSLTATPPPLPREVEPEWPAPTPKVAESPAASTGPLWNPAASSNSWSDPEPSSWDRPAAAPAVSYGETLSFSPPPAAPVAPLGVGMASPGGDRALTDDEIERIARRVVELIGDRIVRDVSWEVIPDLAEVIIKDRIRELEAQVE